MKFRYEHMSLTQIGAIFGTTSHQVGRWLTKIGLRYETKQGLRPSKEAHAGGFVKDVGTGGQNYIWAWHTERTVRALIEAGHKVGIQPGNELLAPCRLNGPFRCRPNAQIGHEIVNADGTVAVCVTGEDNARFLTRLLNLADKHGVVGRLFDEKDEGTSEAGVFAPATERKAR